MDSLQFLTSDMKHYKERFYIPEEENKNVAVRIKPEYVTRLGLEGKREKILLDSWFDVLYSCIRIGKDGVKKFWDLYNLDRQSYPGWRGDFDAYGVQEDEIDDSEYPFNPSLYEFDAPEIGERFFVWNEGRVYETECFSIKIVLGPRWKRFVVCFQEPGLRNILFSGETMEEVLEQIDKYCKKDATEFDNEFWSARYEELRKRKDEEYNALEEDYKGYRDYYG